MSQESKNLYDGKLFYIIEEVNPFRTAEGDLKHDVTLVGPMDNIYFLKDPKQDDFHYIQIIDNKPVAAFKKHEILVTDFLIELKGV